MVAEEQQKAVRSNHRDEEEQQKPRRPSRREAQQEALGAEVSAERLNYWSLLPQLSAKVNVISLVRARPRTPLFTLMFRPPREHTAIKLISKVVSLRPPISLMFLGSSPRTFIKSIKVLTPSLFLKSSLAFRRPELRASVKLTSSGPTPGPLPLTIWVASPHPKPRAMLLINSSPPGRGHPQLLTWAGPLPRPKAAVMINASPARLPSELLRAPAPRNVELKAHIVMSIGVKRPSATLSTPSGQSLGLRPQLVIRAAGPPAGLLKAPLIIWPWTLEPGISAVASFNVSRRSPGEASLSLAFRKANERTNLAFKVTGREELGILKGGPSPQPEVAQSLSQARQATGVEGLDLGPLDSIIGVGRVLGERPIVVFAYTPCHTDEKGNEACDDSLDYIELLKRVLRERYRAVMGGLPTPYHVDLDFIRNRLNIYLPSDIRAGSSIYVIDLRGAKLDDLSKRVIDFLKQRVRELYSQGYGFLVVYGSPRALLKLKVGLGLLRPGEGPGVKGYGKLYDAPYEVKVDPEHVDSFRKFAELMYGRGEQRSSQGAETSVSDYAAGLEEEFLEELSKVVKPPEATRLALRAWPSLEGEMEFAIDESLESRVHYLVKAFVFARLVSHISRHLKEKGLGGEEAFRRALECVKTEDEAKALLASEAGRRQEELNVVPDIYVSRRCSEALSLRGGLDVEVETLYGTGTIIHKVWTAILRRKELLGEALSNVWVVVPNPSALTHIYHLLSLEDELRPLEDAVTLWTLNLDDNDLGLMRLDEVYRELRKVIGGAQAARRLTSAGA